MGFSPAKFSLRSVLCSPNSSECPCSTHRWLEKRAQNHHHYSWQLTEKQRIFPWCHNNLNHHYEYFPFALSTPEWEPKEDLGRGTKGASKEILTLCRRLVSMQDTSYNFLVWFFALISCSNLDWFVQSRSLQSCFSYWTLRHAKQCPLSWRNHGYFMAPAFSLSLFASTMLGHTNPDLSHWSETRQVAYRLH